MSKDPLIEELKTFVREDFMNHLSEYGDLVIRNGKVIVPERGDDEEGDYHSNPTANEIAYLERFWDMLAEPEIQD